MFPLPVWESDHMVLWNVYYVLFRVLFWLHSHDEPSGIIFGSEFCCTWMMLFVISLLLVCSGEHHSRHRQSGHHLQEWTPQVQNQDHERARQQWGPDLPVPCRRRDRVQDQHGHERESQALCLFTQTCLPFPFSTDGPLADMKTIRKLWWYYEGFCLKKVTKV